MDDKRVFLQSIRTDPNATQEARQQAADFDGMEFSEFMTLYQADQSPGTSREFGGGAGVLYVGHVGIISIAAGVPTVVEAVLGKGVQQISYESWLKNRAGSWVWHGRCSNSSEADRAKIAAAAKMHLDQPYNFWNFDLSDTSGYYCSKLCWQATNDSLGVALDGNQNPKRAFWFSPKQMLKARLVEKLFSPGSYTI